MNERRVLEDGKKPLGEILPLMELGDIATCDHLSLSIALDYDHHFKWINSEGKPLEDFRLTKEDFLSTYKFNIQHEKLIKFVTFDEALQAASEGHRIGVYDQDGGFIGSFDYDSSISYAFDGVDYSIEDFHKGHVKLSVLKKV